MNMQEICKRAGVTIVPETWNDEFGAIITLGALRRVAEQAVLMASEAESSKTNKPDLYFEFKDSSRRYYDVYATKTGTVCPDHEDEDYIETIWST